MRITLINPKDPFEKRLFEIISLVMTVAMAYFFVESVFLSGRILTKIIVFSLFIMGTMGYSLSRNGRYSQSLIVLYLGILYACSIFFWFWISGINGATGLGLVTVISISFILIPGKYRNYVISGNLILLLSLSLIHYHMPETMRYGSLSYPMMPIEYAMVAIAHILFVFYLKREVDAEQRRVRETNQKLSIVNDNLLRTVDAQARTLNKLTSAQKKLMESQKMASLGQLTAGLVHEINNPLNYVGGVVHPLKAGLNDLQLMIPSNKREDAAELSKEIEMLLKNIESGTQMASDITAKLQNISTERDQLAVVNISNLILDLVSLVERSEKNIKFNRNIEGDLFVHGNALEMNQVVMNLLRNAIQAIPCGEQGTVEISAVRCGKDVEVIISDNGVGMSEETTERAFEAFYTTKKEKGTGLGLFIAQGIIEKHRGRVTVYSKEAVGTTFRIWIPLLKAS